MKWAHADMSESLLTDGKRGRTFSWFSIRPLIPLTFSLPASPLSTLPDDPTHVPP